VGLAFSLLHKDGTAELFVAPEKLTPEVQAHLGNQVTVRRYDELTEQLSALSGKRVAVDPDLSVAAIAQALAAGGAQVVSMRDPAVLPKATKNAVEQNGTRAAHIRDGAALTRFLRWCTEELVKGGQTELSAAAKLREFREQTGVLKDLSFRTISATGPHGALCHYSVTEETNLAIEDGHLYLVDSGGQYLDGTTDVTRVIAVGEPTEEMRRRYTQVLKGHIALAMARFPKGTSGGALDVLARQHLWADGVDYAHGTGHGVGSYLAVHEGPQRIGMSAGVQAGTGEPLLPGMILSNEPGYYKEGGFGIRIENLVLVRSVHIDGAEGEYLEFENLTWAPLEPRLIDVALLSKTEIDWVNKYHAEVVHHIAPQLSDADRNWLNQVTALIG
jgi:Xaa-Pro aminopeptidase